MRDSLLNTIHNPQPTTTIQETRTVRISAKLDAHIRDLAMVGDQYRRWYFDSRDSIRDYCVAYDRDRQFTTDVIAIYSPRVQVSRNITFAKHFLETGEHPDGSLRARTAAAEHYVRTGKYTGRKVLAFADNLLNPETSQAVTVDTHVAKAYGVGSDFNDDQFQAICRHITAIARTAKMLPHEIQAAIWCGRFRLELGREPEPFLDFSPSLDLIK